MACRPRFLNIPMPILRPCVIRGLLSCFLERISWICVEKQVHALKWVRGVHFVLVLTKYLIKTKWFISLLLWFHTETYVRETTIGSFLKVLVFNSSDILKTSSELIWTSSELISTGSELISTNLEWFFQMRSPMPRYAERRWRMLVWFFILFHFWTRNSFNIYSINEFRWKGIACKRTRNFASQRSKQSVNTRVKNKCRKQKKSPFHRISISEKAT